MSISLNQGFANDTLDHCLEDLIVRFVVNCPEEDLSSYERVLFQIEEANWFYLDYVTTLNPLLQPKRMKHFTRSIVKLCPVVWKWGDPEVALASFGKYKSTIPVRGCALINSNMDKVLLVKGIESNSWGFPRGKISKDEKDVDCAIRELDEETGFDASELIEDDLYVERTLKGKNYKIYIIKNVPENTVFNPKAKFEIVDIKWHSLKKLSKSMKNNSGNFFLINSMLKPIMSHINSWRNSDVDHLKAVATTQLKKLLGVGVEKKELVDPGRELLSFIQNAASKRTDLPKSAGTTATDATTNTNLTNNTNMTPITMPPLPHLPIPMPFMAPFFPPMGFGSFPFGMPPPPPHAMFNNNGMVAHAPSAASLSKPNIRSKVSNSKELLSILTSKVLAPQSASSQGYPQRSSPANGPIRVLKRGEESQPSNASQLMNILKRPPQPEMTPKPSSPSSTTGSPTSTKTELATSSRGNNDPSLLNRPQSSDSSTQLLSILKKPPGANNASMASSVSDSKQLLNMLKKPSSTTINEPNASNGSNQLLNILKKPSENASSSESLAPVPAQTNKSNELLGLVKKPTTSASTATVGNNSNQLLNILKRPSGSGVPAGPTDNGPQQLINILKNPASPAFANSTSKPPITILKKPAPSAPSDTSASVTTANGSTQLLSILKKPSSSEAPAVSQQVTSQQSQSSQLLSMLKKPQTQPATNTQTAVQPTAIPGPTNDSAQLLNLLKKPSAPSAASPVTSPAAASASSATAPSSGAQLLNMVQNGSFRPEPATALSSNEYSDDYEDFEDFEDDDCDGVNVAAYDSDSD